MRKKIYSNRKGKADIEEKNTVKDVIGLILYCLVIVVIMLLFIKFVAQRTIVIGQSMEYTLQDGDNLLTDKITYRFSDPKRYDIIVFPYKENKSQLLIKRIIGMPGEKVQIIHGEVYINDQLIDDTYGNASMENAGLAEKPIILGPDEYFVLGDNRNNSKDSRFDAVGNVNRSMIIGKAFVRFWPIQNFTLLKHQ